MGFCVCSMFCCAVSGVLSSFAIILMGKRKSESWFLYLIAFLVSCDCVFCGSSSRCRGLIVVFSDHTHLPFYMLTNTFGNT